MTDQAKNDKFSMIQHDQSGLPSFELYCAAVMAAITEAHVANIPQTPDDLLSPEEKHRARVVGALLAYLADGLANFAFDEVGQPVQEILDALSRRMAMTVHTREVTDNLMHRL